jgi:hypothetical protein
MAASAVFIYWCSYGLSPRTANSLIAAGCNTFDDVRAHGIEHMLYYSGFTLGEKSYNEIAVLLDWPQRPFANTRRTGSAIQVPQVSATTDVTFTD